MIALIVLENKGGKVNTELLINGQFEKGASDSEDVINPTNGDLISAIPQASEDQIDKDKIIFQSSHFPDVNQAVIEGMGIGPFTVFQANQITNLVKVPIDLPQYQESMWFVYHKDLKHSARIQCFYECLSEHLSTL